MLSSTLHAAMFWHKSILEMQGSSGKCAMPCDISAREAVLITYAPQISSQRCHCCTLPNMMAAVPRWMCVAGMGRGAMGPPPPGGGRGGPPRGASGIDGAKWERGLRPPPPPPGANFGGPQHAYGRPAPSLHKTDNAYKVSP